MTLNAKTKASTHPHNNEINYILFHFSKLFLNHDKKIFLAAIGNVLFCVFALFELITLYYNTLF